MPTGINRRNFMEAASAGIAAPAVWAQANRPPSERVRVGWIGCGARGSGELRMIARHPDAEIVAVSDAIESRMAQARDSISRGANPQKPEMVLDYRRILDRKDIDAVFITTTQHWHGIPFIHACQAGKAIYVEKPLGHTIVECKAMLEAARKYGSMVLMGTQQRAGAHYQKAVEIVRSGRLGRIGLVESWNYYDRNDRVPRAADSEPPADCHWDLWLGPAPFVPFNAARLQHNWWIDYSGGILTNWGPHHFDFVLWAMQADWPKTVVATGGKFVLDDQADTYDTFEGVWEFPNFLLTYRAKSFNNFHYIQSRPRHHGVAFYGKQATLIVDRYGYELYSNTTDKKYAIYEFPMEPPIEKMAGFPYSTGTLPDGRTDGQDGPFQLGFIDCVKGRKKPPIDLVESYRGTVWCQLGVAAYLSRRRLTWDGQKETIVGDSEAARLMDRPRRKGYELPKV
jgi:predicted dehydrogenase